MNQLNFKSITRMNENKETQSTCDRLKGKRILFIGVKFYDYSQEIIRRLQACGAHVNFFYERDTSILYGIYNRLFNRQLNQFQFRHYAKILKRIRHKKFDYILVIRGHKMPVFFMKQIKEMNPGIESIMFQWDSNYNSPFIDLSDDLNVLPYFNRVFSFDYKDVYDNDFLRYAPTFSTDEFRELYFRQTAEPFDFFYFGNYLPERYKGLVAFRRFADENGYTFKHYLYMHWRYFLIERIKGNKLDHRLIKFRMLSRKGYIRLFSKSKAIVDVSNANQTGVAMRVLDGLVAGKKIVTTNRWIQQDDVYHPDQVAIIDMDKIELPKEFLNNKKKLVQPDFSIDKWINTVFFS